MIKIQEKSATSTSTARRSEGRGWAIQAAHAVKAAAKATAAHIAGDGEWADWAPAGLWQTASEDCGYASRSCRTPALAKKWEALEASCRRRQEACEKINADAEPDRLRGEQMLYDRDQAQYAAATNEDGLWA